MFSSNDLEDFGTKLKDIRLKNNLTQSDVNKLVYISIDGLRRIENGHVIPKYETLELLSQVYKVDLINVLKTCRSNTYLCDFYKEIDNIINTGSSDRSEKLLKEVNKLDRSNSSDRVISKHELSQLRTFIKCSEKYYDKTYREYEDIVGSLVQSIQLTSSSFSLDKIDHSNLSLLEIRLLLLIGLVKAQSKNYKESNIILKQALKQLIMKETASTENNNIRIKIYFNLSYNYHIMNNYPSELEYAIEGINFAKEIKSTYCLPWLFFRKSIAEHYQGNMGYKKTLLKAINLFYILDDEKNALFTIKVAQEKHGIELDHLDLSRSD